METASTGNMSSESEQASPLYSPQFLLQKQTEYGKFEWNITNGWGLQWFWLRTKNTAQRLVLTHQMGLKTNRAVRCIINANKWLYFYVTTQWFMALVCQRDFCDLEKSLIYRITIPLVIVPSWPSTTINYQKNTPAIHSWLISLYYRCFRWHKRHLGTIKLLLVTI